MMKNEQRLYGAYFCIGHCMALPTAGACTGRQLHLLKVVSLVSCTIGR
jgi:hypothetical protein